MDVTFSVSCMFPHAKFFEFVPFGNRVVESRNAQDVTVEQIMRDAVDVLVSNGVAKSHISASTVDAYDKPLINLYIVDNVNIDKLAKCLRLKTPTCNNRIKSGSFGGVYDVVSFISDREVA